jgi:putative FmdB family regulatory protein
MPTYEYRCDACGHDFEEFQYFSEEPLTKCPACKKKKLRRLFGTGASIIFKGSGFYETDYRSESYKSAAKKDQESAKPASGDASGNGSAGKSDTGGTAGAAKPAPAAKGAGKSAKSKG